MDHEINTLLKVSLEHIKEMIDVDNVVPQPLKNGDCIELSRNVRLMFNVLS